MGEDDESAVHMGPTCGKLQASRQRCGVHNLHVFEVQGLSSADNNERQGLIAADPLGQYNAVTSAIIYIVIHPWPIRQQARLGAQPHVPLRPVLRFCKHKKKKNIVYRSTMMMWIGDERVSGCAAVLKRTSLEDGSLKPLQRSANDRNTIKAIHP
jgi:hypothetical protein